MEHKNQHTKTNIKSWLQQKFKNSVQASPYNVCTSNFIVMRLKIRGLRDYQSHKGLIISK